MDKVVHISLLHQPLQPMLSSFLIFLLELISWTLLPLILAWIMHSLGVVNGGSSPGFLSRNIQVNAENLSNCAGARCDHIHY
ncbi:hypothetical protein BDP81DRAFT_431749 [Colletotrichum phormii]|uniref:Uncharacterized protein n=1 Tax=Colletotrichum phormii TaxID=359342 RepID=A0AAJ0EF27_9PEZI|nr:uncharacterized protein BDP81DRAFT_431749 [Colletotrichum phormii]KAK1634676.1 hypothetical protein BDP81DRAFT_431749 [Colletotrichum phormii]